MVALLADGIVRIGHRAAGAGAMNCGFGMLATSDVARLESSARSPLGTVTGVL